MTQQKSLIATAISIFEDGICYLSQLKPEQYTQQLALFSGATVGQHTRHWIEFFQCLLNNAALGQKVSYDKRERNPVIENEPEIAIEVIEHMKYQLLDYPELEDLIIEAQMPDDSEIELHTSFKRELWFVIEHAVHHLALIKIGLKADFPDCNLPEHFGVATSTLAHQTSA